MIRHFGFGYETTRRNIDRLKPHILHYTELRRRHEGFTEKLQLKLENA